MTIVLAILSPMRKSIDHCQPKSRSWTHFNTKYFKCVLI